MDIKAKPIDFKFNEYLSKGYELLKKDFGNILLAVFFCIIMSIIPFCGFLAMGNLYKFLKKVNKGQQASAGEIFNFDNFTSYFILQLIIIGGVLLFYIPLLFMLPVIKSGHEPSGNFLLFFIPYFIILYIAIIIISLKGFYIPGLISLGGIKDIKTAWSMSVVMSKNNLLSIFLFSLVVSIIGQLGIILCGIGVFLTIPFIYTAHYCAFEDAFEQVENDEIKEIGLKNE
ncbi:hypothetical protein D1632_01325 [Chryseobacterium nematophagum]|uniref:DUF4013 domain-containing protein n=1 Tax=Chryseobacterium nematophagum TaxID=2305228 RepID=A0A3M7LEY4_9FLAO|nr:hypothetical protein [Chryseobacterium nematophagum]RMZ60654.1 hypothetical protein D1632_01325 [Chryseobacterium nematophagum]